ncbi:LacI family DNA-binding transcriptional regulator [Pelagicoccus albus]|uniref:LacI family DNA-binding transcriptional regulator n=1 Tax=Pelagicoccus albus TaxID=415222 RepID=A0A7X1B6D5_9BACT|nr:LacI family DNA-binding transcriptional regulator [Pelagicoccus albus]MBC2606496.1 LacI family DNA-binding transcriptional regulator [Pelagicoccus albus]
MPKKVESNEGSGDDRKATIYDLARISGYSSGTVSRVLNNRANVAQKTRDRILKAAKELNIRPQLSARMRQVAILTDPFSSDRLEGYTANLTSHLAFALSHRDIAVSFPANPMEDLPKMFLDGIIAINCVSNFGRFLAEMETRLPVVYMDKFDVSGHQYSVRSDHYDAGRKAADYLIARGKKKLAFFAQKTLPHEERLRGFRDGIESAGLTVDPFSMVLDDTSARLAAITRIAKSGADSIFIPGSSYQALEALHILTYVMGLKVPEDISIVGGENEGISAISSPPLTTIEEPLQEMAEGAVEMMDKLIAGSVVEEKVRTLPISLIERNSVSGT